MKKVSINAMPIRTWFGGICWVPIAFLVKESTIIILGNVVTVIMIAGINVKRVNTTTSLTTSVVFSSFWINSSTTDSCAKAAVKKLCIIIMKKKISIRFLICFFVVFFEKLAEVFSFIFILNFM